MKESNQSATAQTENATILSLFEEQVERKPDAIAVEFLGHGLTYHELNQRAEALAAVLRNKGVEAETLVGLYVERSIEMVVSLLGIMKAGGAYVPLDPYFPEERLAFMLADAQVPVLVTQARLAGQLPKHQALVVCVDAAGDNHTPPLGGPPCSPANLAYVLYTSGSTGRPKGVEITHRSVANFLSSMAQAPGFQASDVLLAITTLSFDIAGLEIFLPLITGGKVVIAPREITMDGPRLAQLMTDCGATVMQATPATWRMLLDSGWKGDRRLKILCGGEAFGPDLAERLLARCGELWNMYGPTETTIWSTIEKLSPGQPITIGRPIANTTAHVLNEHLQPVPTGVAGELFLGGVGLARGYRNRPDLTSERFVLDPFSATKTNRLYRTGDIAAFQPDGRIAFLGRADHQIKLRGFRIELGEIETALAAEPGIAQAVVVAVEDESQEKRLVAYVVPQTAPPDASALRAALRLKLPDYMVPSTFVFLQNFPLTPNGKVDRKALPRPAPPAASEATDDAPRGACEVQLAGIMAALLKVPRIGRRDNFFDLGGHSILAATLFSEIDREFGRRLPLATLLTNPTVELLARLLKTQDDPGTLWRSLVPMQPLGTQSRFFCIHGAGGNVLLYRDLARHFGTDFPFYGLQSPGMDGRTPPLRTVEEMAKMYVAEIRELQPEGPYCLGGYCLGGTIAYEIAQLLQRDGHEVALLALLDTYNFARMERPKALAYIRQKLTFHLSNLTNLRMRDWPGYLARKVRIAMDGELSSWWKTLSRSSKNNPAESGGSSIEASVQEANDAAAAAYRPNPYRGRMVVFKPRVNYDFYPDPQLGWGDLVSDGLEFVELPVNPHAMLVEPYVGLLAERLKESIQKGASLQNAAK